MSARPTAPKQAAKPAGAARLPPTTTQSSAKQPAGASKTQPPATVAGVPITWQPRCELCRVNFADFDPRLPLRCKPCFEQITDWDNAESWDDLLIFNRDFIEGARTATPYSIFPLFNDSNLWPGLLRLHDFGVMVTDAQAGYHKIGQESDGKWFELKERAYLRCVIPTNSSYIKREQVEWFLDLLLATSDIEVIMFYDHADYLAGKFNASTGYRTAPPVSARTTSPSKIPRSQFFRSSMGPSLAGRTMSKYRSADKEEDLVYQKWKRCRHNRLSIITERDLPVGSRGFRAFGRETTLTIGLRLVVFNLVARRWTDTEIDLAEIVESTCEIANMEPVFVYSSEDEMDGNEVDKTGSEDLSGQMNQLSVD